MKKIIGYVLVDDQNNIMEDLGGRAGQFKTEQALKRIRSVKINKWKAYVATQPSEKPYFDREIARFNSGTIKPVFIEV